MHAILQHRRLLDVLKSIEECIASADAEHWREAEQLLDELLRLLAEHFAVEVATTFPDARARRNSEQAELVARLDAEHPLLIEGFERVRRLLRDPTSTQQERAQAFEQAGTAFRVHEACENALFMELY